jgi:hypothetical protein
MIYWALIFNDDNYRSVEPVEGDSYGVWIKVDETSILHWKPIPVGFRESKVPDDRLIGDFSYVPASIPILTERALRLLQPFIQSQVALLPLIFGEETLWIAYPTNHVNCYDKKASDFFKYEFPDIVVYVSVKNLVFPTGCVDDLHIFQLDVLRSNTFVSDAFKKTVEDNNLGGFMFRQVTHDNS